MTGFDLDTFVEDCRAARQEDTPQPAVRDVVERAVADAPSVERALGAANGWRIEALHHSDDMTILHFIPVKTHSGCHCWWKTAPAPPRAVEGASQKDRIKVVHPVHFAQSDGARRVSSRLHLR